MPNDVLSDEDVGLGLSDSDVGLSITPEAVPQSGLERAARDWQLGPLARAPQGRPPPALGESALGISPAMIPSGANTSFPAITIPLSALGKTAAGVGQFLTSPQGLAESAAAATPAAPVIMAKWAYDMARGGYKSTKAIVDELGQMANEAFNRGVINANNLGPIPEGTTTQEHIQSLAENAANAAVMGLGVAGIASHALRRDKVAPTTETAVPGAIPEPTPPLPETPRIVPHETRLQTPEEREFELLHEHWLPTIKPWRQEMLREQVTKGEGTDTIELNMEDSPGKRDVVRAKRYYELARKLFARTGEEVPPTEPTPNLPKEEAPPSSALPGESPTAPAVSAAKVPVAAGTEPATVEPTLIRTTTQGELPPEHQTIKAAWEGYDELDTLKTPRDLANAIDALPEDVVVPKYLARALQRYKDAIEEDFTEFAGRGDVEPHEERFLEAVEKAASAKPKLKGMGGALAKGEIPETGAGGEKYGVAERVRAERAQAGQVAPVEPGEGTTPEKTIAMGRDIVRRDPEAGPRILAKFEADPEKQTSETGIAVVRAHGESLAAGARTIEETYGTESLQYAQAKAYLDDWDKRSKAMQTQWHRQGQAQQGETDIDTGSYTGLERARKQTTGKDIPDKEKPRAKKIANENKKAQKELDVASDKLNKRIIEKASKDPEQSKVWQLAKKYLDENKGIYHFADLTKKIGTDLGMKPEQVAKILSKDKTTKRLADDMWLKQRNARRLKESAKMWLKELDTPGYIRALSSIPDAMFNLAVFGHGFVALGTHAPIVAFQPRFWNAYVRNFGKMYKMVFSPTYYEAQMADLVRRPNYEKALRAGLQVDPFKYEEFHTTAVRDLVKDWIGEKNMNRVDNFASAGNRGYGVLKLLRQDMFDQKYDKLPDSVRGQPDFNKALANDINHATGVTAKAAPKGANLALFAPRLAGSRVMWLFGDPLKAGRTVANWKNASAADKLFAVNQMREKGWVLGTFASLLAANQGLLTAAGSKQKINGIPEFMGGAGFDPLAGDFMKFKALGGDIAYGGALLTMAKLPVRVATAILYDGKGSKYVLEDERVDKVIGSYIRSQMSPFAGTVSDLALGRDYEERPLPSKMFGTVEQTGAVPKRLQEQGVDEPYNWPEFAATKLPIPIAEGFKEGLKGAGMNDQQANYWLKAAAITTLMTATGTRITEDTREE